MADILLNAPFYRDPIYDCPTDPTMIWNREEKQWYMFYTQRRAQDPIIGVAWVHGTDIGVASSKDGKKWLYRGVLPNLAIEPGHNTFWAPEIVWAKGQYHMYVTYITGIANDWDYPRDMLHYVSDDLWNWTFLGEIDLESERVIDACLYEVEPGTFKMWYKQENDNSHTYAAISTDLSNWKVLGPETLDVPEEGPNVFELGGYKWMICDYWHGLAVYRSDDFTHWERCADILNESGTRDMDKGLGHHADIIVRGDRAFILYFCHPFAGDAGDYQKMSPVERSKAVVQMAELKVVGDQIVCDRNADCYWPEEPDC